MAVANGLKAIVNVVTGLWLIYSCVLILIGLAHGDEGGFVGLAFLLVGLSVRFGLFYIIDSFSDE